MTKAQRKIYMVEYYKKHKQKMDLTNRINYKKRMESIPGRCGELIKWIKNRCKIKSRHNSRQYVGKGIKCLLNVDDLVMLWERDNAGRMKKPSIDRINSNRHYTFKNCRFIEQSENSKRTARSYVEKVAN